MRLGSVLLPDHGAILCAIDGDGHLRAVGDIEPVPADVSELVAKFPGASLEEAVERAGIGAAVGDLEELLGGVADGRRLLAPVRPAEVWAAGVTYERSRDARMFESDEKDIYERVYVAERPELFFKATGARVVGPGAPVGLRSDSDWQVPEPEVGLVLGAGGAVLGYTLGNDMSSRDIEGVNPLYLPQAKIFAGACALGPLVVTPEEIGDPEDIEIHIAIERADDRVFEGTASTARLHVDFETLVSFLRRDNWLPPGAVLLTGTGVVPGDDFTLEEGDVVTIWADPIGRLRNTCAPAATLPPPDGWD